MPDSIREGILKKEIEVDTLQWIRARLLLLALDGSHRDVEALINEFLLTLAIKGRTRVIN